MTPLPKLPNAWFDNKVESDENCVENDGAGGAPFTKTCAPVPCSYQATYAEVSRYSV
jgi:hypothetical protein